MATGIEPILQTCGRLRDGRGGSDAEDSEPLAQSAFDDGTLEVIGSRRQKSRLS